MELVGLGSSSSMESFASWRSMAADREAGKVIGDATSRRWVKNKLTTIGRDKSLKAGKDEWREREREEQNFERKKGDNEVWTLKSNFSKSKLKTCTHKASLYSQSVTQNWREIWISIQISLEFEFEFKFVEPNLEPKFH